MNIRAGETQIAVVHLRLFQDVPSTAYFSALKTTTDVPQQPYDIPVRAEILLTPNTSLNNSLSAKIPKFSYLTLTITPPLGFGDELASAWNTFGSPINGFVPVILAIATFVGGSLLKGKGQGQKE